MRAQGMSTRAIATQIGVSHEQVRKDLASSPVYGCTGDDADDEEQTELGDPGAVGERAE